MDTIELFQRLGLALAIGFLIGLERGWKTRNEPEGGRSAGLRTHALAGVLGGVWGALAVARPDGGLIALALAFAVFGGAVVLFRYREAQAEQTFGMTTVVAAMLAFALGAYAVMGDMAVAGAMGVAVAALLAFKPVLHDWVQRISWVELRSGLLLLAMTFIMLPLLPKRTIDPWDTINPFELWLLTVMIAAISFAGYVAIKAVGERHGIIMTGVAGGLASSTAVTVTLAELAKEHPERRDPLVAGALFASATMIARVLVVVGTLGAVLLPRLLVPVALGGLVLLAAGTYFLGRQQENGVEEGKLQLKNPFDLATVLKFGALLTVVTVLAKLLTRVGGGEGVYALAAFSGIADVDAITLSMSRLAQDPASVSLAANAILIVVAVNTVAKAVLGWIAGGAEFGRRLMAVAAAAVAAGAAGALFAPTLG
jgi:uncharacterized membrane protein (DUF4010 family)